MTRPSLICFLGKNGDDEPKIFIRTLLYGTSEKGQYIQNMFARLHRAETIQNFNIWAYNEDEVVRGSGLFVDKTGVSFYHHFLLPKNERWEFVAGEYKLQIFAETVDSETKKLFEHRLVISSEQGNSLRNHKNACIFFDWTTNTQSYVSHVNTRPPMQMELI